MGSARLIALRLLVISLATLLGWLAIGWSVWAFALERRFGESGRIALSDFVGMVPVYDLTLVALIFVVQILTFFAYVSAIHAFLRLYAVRVVAGALTLALYVAALMYLVRAGRLDGTAVAFTHAWILTVGGFVAALYLYRNALVDRILTPFGLIAVLTVWVTFCAAILLGSGIQRSAEGVDPATLSALLLFMLVPFVAAALAPWSFSRIRHR